MRDISNELKTAFVNGTRATLMKIVTRRGKIYGYTDHTVELDVEGVKYVPAPGLSRIQLARTINDTVSNQDIGSAWVDAPEEALLAGEFDNAEIEISFCDWSNPANGKLVMEHGRLGVIQWTADGFRADMQSWMRDLQKLINIPVTAGCRHRLFSQPNDSPKLTTVGACMLNKVDYRCVGAVTSTVVPKLVYNVEITSGTIADPLNWFAGGHMIVQDVASDSQLYRRPLMIKSSTLLSANNYKIEFFLPTPLDLGTAQIHIYPGCDKTMETCKNKFDNVINFGGFPHIKPEVLYR